MAKIVVTWEPQEGERKIVRELLGDDAVWLVDGIDPEQARCVFAFWPRREVEHNGPGWDRFPQATLLKVPTAGVNHVGWSSLPERFRVAATPGATGEAIAEHVLAFILDWARGIHRSTDDIRAGRFRVGAPVRALSRLSVGLVGYGGIGKATSRILAALGATVQAVSRSGARGQELEWGGTMEDLPRLLGQSDVVVLCLPLVQDTVGLVDGAFLARMRRQSLLVNVARGPVVDEEALYQWLAGDEEHAAALDVWWRYPNEGRPFTQPFDTLPNVAMTPHNSPNVSGFRRTMIEAACHDLAHWLETGAVDHAQSREAHSLQVDGDPR